MRRLALVFGLLATPAFAQSPRDAIFPSDASCYLRHYSAGHLASHPQQNVAEIALGPEPATFDAPVLGLRLALYRRGSNTRYEGRAACENTGGALSCQLEGDGGWFTLWPKADGTLRLEVGRGGLIFEAADFLEVSGISGDDRVFVLPRVPADSCP